MHPPRPPKPLHRRPRRRHPRWDPDLLPPPTHQDHNTPLLRRTVALVGLVGRAEQRRCNREHPRLARESEGYRVLRRSDGGRVRGGAAGSGADRVAVGMFHVHVRTIPINSNWADADL